MVFFHFLFCSYFSSSLYFFILREKALKNVVNKVTHPLRRAAREEYAAVTDHSKRAENVLNGTINGIFLFPFLFLFFQFYNERKKPLKMW